MFRVEDIATGRQPGRNAAEMLSARVHELHGPQDLVALDRPAPSPVRCRIGEQLVAEGLVTRAALAEALALQPGLKGRRLGWILVMLDELERTELDRVLAARQGVPSVTLWRYRADPGHCNRFSAATSRRFGIALLHEDERAAWVAFANPFDQGSRELATFLLGKRIVALRVESSEIESFVSRLGTGTQAGPQSGAPWQRSGAANASVRAGPGARGSLDFLSFRAA